MNSRRFKNGFTLIELLLVIGIITLLLALLFPTIAIITNRAKATQTRQTMQTLVNMFGTYQQATMLNQSPTAVGLPANYWGSVTTAGVTTGYQETAPSGSLLPGTTNRDGSTMSQHTIIVMWLLESIPENMQAMQNLPVGMTETATLPSSSTTVLLALDGWGNPILFAPPGGLTGLIRGGEWSASNGSTAATYTNQTVVAPNGRPYWVSAGPDTQLQTMDDDVFSFRDR